MLKAKITRRETGSKTEAMTEAAKEETTRLNAEIPTSLHKRLKFHAVSEGKSITELTVRALNEFLSKHSSE